MQPPLVSPSVSLFLSMSFLPYSSSFLILLVVLPLLLFLKLLLYVEVLISFETMLHCALDVLELIVLWWWDYNCETPVCFELIWILKFRSTVVPALPPDPVSPQKAPPCCCLHTYCLNVTSESLMKEQSYSTSYWEMAHQKSSSFYFWLDFYKLFCHLHRNSLLDMNFSNFAPSHGLSILFFTHAFSTVGIFWF